MKKSTTRSITSGQAPPYLPLRGRALTDTELRQEVTTTQWAPRLDYAWDAGIAISRFLDGFRQGKIYGVRCRQCGRIVTPPRAFCELDFKPMDDWVELANTGTINTFSICYVTWDMKPLRIPQIPAVIEIDGTHPRVGFLHLVGGVRGRTVSQIRRQVRVGLPVRAVWKPAAKRVGAITDILYFKPLQKGRVGRLIAVTTKDRTTAADAGERSLRGDPRNATRSRMPREISKVSDARVWRGTMPVQFLYTAGAAGERFFQVLRQEGVFAVTACPDCRITYLPPRLYCERCFADLSNTWGKVAPVGHVHTFTVAHEDQHGHPLDAPQIVAFVRIDGTDGGLTARLVRLRVQDVRLDMPVEAVLAPPRKRRGGMGDLLGFTPRHSTGTSRRRP